MAGGGGGVGGALKKLAKTAYKGWQLWKTKLTEPWSQIFRDLIQVLLLTDHMVLFKAPERSELKSLSGPDRNYSTCSASFTGLL